MEKTLFIIASFILVSLGVYDVLTLNAYATDVPFWDTWDLLPMGSYGHLFDFYNENMQFFYFLISEIIYRVADWNLRYFIAVNFLVYLSVILIYGIILNKTRQDKKIAFYPLFLCILLTPMLGYNWLWVFLVQTHTFILFFLLAIYFGFTKQDKVYSAYACGVCLFLSVISMNIPLAVGGTIAYIIKEAVNGKTNGWNKCIKNCAALLCTLGLLMACLMLMTDISNFVNVRMSHTALSWDYLKNLSFYLINSLSVFAFADVINWQIALPWACLHFSLLFIAFCEQYDKKHLQSLWGLTFGILFCMCGIIALRGGEVYSYDYTFIRHNETAFMMLPAVMMIFFLSKYKLIRGYAILILGLSLCGIAADMRAQRFQFFGNLFYKNGCLCLNHYYNLKTIKDWQCTMNFPIPRPDAMEKGQKMNLSFIKTISDCY